MDPGGHQAIKFAWGLSVATNNESESLAAFQGLKCFSKSTAGSIMVVGNFNSTLIINALHNKGGISSPPTTIISQTKPLLQILKQVTFAHVLWSNSPLITSKLPLL